MVRIHARQIPLSEQVTPFTERSQINFLATS
jgi:hypothetical protein